MEVECVYEKGVLRPLRRIRLKEKERVIVEVRSSIVNKTKGMLKNYDIDKIIEEIESGVIL
ncbi:MAG: antitoxin [Candidatus Altiarchaeales archaeon]|nr:MAG: antitoxin [Candidatus Altiarchaeales archaeon]